MASGASWALYAETYRPQFRFTPAKMWMHDPNGLVYFDGEYHLFFQHDQHALEPESDRLLMTWGHAVSYDLVHWCQIDHALEPDEIGGMWSGSAVVDWDNSSCLGTADSPPLIALYTATHLEHRKRSAQCLVYNEDRGRTWMKYTGNPVLGHIAGANRDPGSFAMRPPASGSWRSTWMATTSRFSRRPI